MTTKKAAKPPAKKRAARAAEDIDIGLEYGPPGALHEDLPDGSDGAALTFNPADRTAFFLPRSISRLGPEAEEVATLLQGAVRELTVLQGHIAEAVVHGRALGLSWDSLGYCLGMTGEGIRKRFSDD